ncbi:MAG: HipA domain-containing protein [Epsilonproteobacteria bacterium]|nr:HipA domain-containing protein [Campylobacterota bacterium]
MKIYVLKQNQALGFLEEPTIGNIHFTYLDGISPQSYIEGIDEEKNVSDDGLFLIFQNMFPENGQIEALKTKYEIRTTIELLLYLEDVHGSYTFLTQEDWSKHSNPMDEEHTNYVYSEIRDEVLANNYTFPNILEHALNIPLEKRFPGATTSGRVIGLSGFQYKFSIAKEDTKKELCISKDGRSYYFMKPYSKHHTTFMPHDKERLYIPYLLINEHLFMTLARDLGFDVPYNAIIKDGEDYHYVIKRYDRYKNEKFDHVEFATLLGYNSNTKYDATVQEILKKADEYIGKEGVEELLLFFYFSTLIGHGDLHAKNISLIHASNEIGETNREISPYYDISTTHIYRGLKDREIGLALLGRKSKIKKEYFLQLAKKHELRVKDFEAKMKDITDNFVKLFPRLIAALPASILELPYQKKYGAHAPLKSILDKYYLERKKYIKQYIDDTWIKEDVHDIF